MSQFLKAFALFLLVAVSTFALGQGAPAAEKAPSSESVAAQPEHSQAAEAGDAKKSESPEAEKDEEAQFKESGSVKWLGKKLGLDPDQAYWVSWIFNFLIIAGLMVFALKSSLPTIFRERTAAIQKGIEEARRASAESAARLSDIESRLSRLDTDIAEMRSRAEQDAAAEDQRLRVASEEEKRKIVQNAEQEIAAAANTARRELKQFAAELAVSLAEKKISVNEAVDRALVREFATHLTDDNRASSKGGR
jgi:F-type H+-transporting ATPase subunit b